MDFTGRGEEFVLHRYTQTGCTHLPLQWVPEDEVADTACNTELGNASSSTPLPSHV